MPAVLTLLRRKFGDAQTSRSRIFPNAYFIAKPNFSIVHLQMLVRLIILQLSKWRMH